VCESAARAADVRFVSQPTLSTQIKELAGTLRVGLVPTLAPYLLPHVVPHVHARYPKLELLLVEEKTEVVLDRLRDGDLDVGVLARPVNDPQLHEELLFTEDFLLAVPADGPLGEVRERSTSTCSSRSTCSCSRRGTACATSARGVPTCGWSRAHRLPRHQLRDASARWSRQGSG
jgi:DNA-binding transcriptional LysR family regulator